MPSPFTFLTLHLYLLFILFSLHVQANHVISEDGYTFATVLDGHKLRINPYFVLQRPHSSDLVIVDSSNSTFYTVQLPISQESVFKRFSGNGLPGYDDGDVDSARFDKPRSFAVDTRGNVYVADWVHKVIRKISTNGVTTIAGASSKKSNIKDGPAQNASLSNDFELTFVPALCALLVSDHMHWLVLQINLKEEDCTIGSKSGLGAVMTWTLGLGLSCLLGLIIGVVVRPYIIPPHERTSRYHFTVTWKHCQISLGKLLPTLYSGIRSAVASCNCSSVFAVAIKLWRLSLSLIVLVFNIDFVFPRRPHLESVSLLDLDACNSGEISKSSKYFDQMKDLMSFDEDVKDSTKKTLNRGSMRTKDSSNILHQESSVANLGVVKRR